MAEVPKKVLKGKLALVAGATRGASRGIAIALGEARAIGYWRPWGVYRLRWSGPLSKALT